MTHFDANQKSSILKLDDIIVVEGKTDSNKLKKLFNVKTIETNGSRISIETINLIKAAAKFNNIILFLDPDNAGEKIRKRLQNELINFKQAFIKKPVGTKKIGVAEATDEQIINALKEIKIFNNNNESISLNEFKNLNLNSKFKRNIVTNYLKISECNSKQLFRRLNMLNLSFDDVKKIILK